MLRIGREREILVVEFGKSYDSSQNVRQNP
jgi:hypothetical protein